MKSNREANENEPVRMELKYCEHCGGLWVREPGAGVVCGKCQAKVADLPIPKKKLAKVRLPVRPRTAVEEFQQEIENADELDFKAAGGVA